MDFKNDNNIANDDAGVKETFGNGLLTSGAAEEHEVNLEELEKNAESDEDGLTDSASSFTNDGSSSNLSVFSVYLGEHQQTFEQTFDQLMEQLIEEKQRRENAETKLLMVEMSLDQNVRNDVENIRLALMKLDILVNDPNRAREDMYQQINDEQHITRRLQERLIVLKNQCDKLREEVASSKAQYQILLKNNKKMRDLLNQLGK